MVFCIIIALLSTFVYLNLILSDAINIRNNPGASASRDANTAVLVAKIKYALILIMSVCWGIVINHCIN